MLESEVSLCWGEWDSAAAMGTWWGRIMAGGVSKACQKSYWGRLSSYRSSGFLLCLITKVSVNTTINKQHVYSSTATCFDSHESSSG